ncbi:MAG: hypothetical protein NTW56_13635 [Alphaproteobacteria bacterium]|nr:hypothetical protein [Alphaproteobacteria bacterium]
MNSILIWGAGAIGSTVGAYLARAGHDVLLVDVDAAHVAATNGTPPGCRSKARWMPSACRCARRCRPM